MVENRTHKETEKHRRESHAGECGLKDKFLTSNAIGTVEQIMMGTVKVLSRAESKR